MRDMMIYTKSDAFKSGWVAGFYDALRDDGLRYLDDILRYGPRCDDDEAFMDGYRAGRYVRRGSSFSDDFTSVVVTNRAA